MKLENIEKLIIKLNEFYKTDIIHSVIWEDIKMLPSLRRVTTETSILIAPLLQNCNYQNGIEWNRRERWGVGLALHVRWGFLSSDYPLASFHVQYPAIKAEW